MAPTIEVSMFFCHASRIMTLCVSECMCYDICIFVYMSINMKIFVNFILMEDSSINNTLV